ncbi:MAG: hypothetical protein MUO54_13985, partial [Anaerolineales bacterium]|nr:hypothetical protein [Anaerolineales bacterium]
KSDPRLPFLPLLSKFIPYIAKGKSDWQDKNAVENHFSYAEYPTKAILQLTYLLEALQAAIPKVTAPALLIHARKDLGVAPENMDLIYNQLGTADHLKNKILLENSGHVVTRDQDKDIVFSSVLSFIKQTLSS